MGNYAYTSNPKSKNNLLQLDLSQMGLTHIPNNLAYFLSQSILLMQLNLSYNQLTSIPKCIYITQLPFEYISIQNSFRNRYKYKKLSLSGNNIVEFPNLCTNYLTIANQLYLDYNRLIALSKLVKIPDSGLETLAIHQNSDLDFNQFPAYEHFNSLIFYWYY